MKCVFLEELPRLDGYNNQRIDWKKSVGHKVKFIYDEIKGEIEIIKYTGKKSRVVIRYENSSFEISSTGLINARMGNIVGKITPRFKLALGVILMDEKRDLTIVDREFRLTQKSNGTSQNFKWYKYHCNKCHYEGWTEEAHLLKRRSGCSCCGISKKKIVLGINTIWDTDRWMVDLGVSEEDAKTHVSKSNKKIRVKCPDCGRERIIQIGKIYSYNTISCACGDGFSYSEKFMYSVLEQLNVEFITQLSKTNLKWCNNYRYDFYLPSLDIIIETHGIQHYKGGFKKDLKEEEENDRNKRELAFKNKIKDYIVIDCRYSKSEWIKENIINSDLINYFDLSKIDWSKCVKFTASNIIREVCKYWENKKYFETVKSLAEVFKLSKYTITKYLKIGTELNWCNYEPHEEIVKNGHRSKRKLKEVEVSRNGVNLGTFKSRKELSNQSKKIFGVELLPQNISAVCVGIQTHHKGFVFRYI